MPVYVDNAKIPFKKMKCSHMAATSLDELHKMADKIGLKRDWFQDKPGNPHYQSETPNNLFG